MKEASTIVIALGGNALQKNGETDTETQKELARITARQLTPLIRAGHKVVVAHGNGPQVGAILLNEETASKTPAPLDTCVAMSQGEIGYWLQQALCNELRAAGMRQTAVTMVTQVQVSEDDEAFQDPTKPIGPFYPDEQTARETAKQRQFIVKEDAGRGWRRVVASPLPIDIVEKDAIVHALAAGVTVIAGGGGGVPVVERNGQLVGVEAVIDKDFAAAKIADLVSADMLVVLTAVDAVSINYGKPDQKDLTRVSYSQLSGYVAQHQFAPGSMLPKVQASMQFVGSGPNRTVVITSPQQLTAALQGKAGTHVFSD